MVLHILPLMFHLLSKRGGSLFCPQLKLLMCAISLKTIHPPHTFLFGFLGFFCFSFVCFFYLQKIKKRLSCQSENIFLQNNVSEWIFQDFLLGPTAEKHLLIMMLPPPCFTWRCCVCGDLECLDFANLLSNDGHNAQGHFLSFLQLLQIDIGVSHMILADFQTGFHES